MDRNILVYVDLLGTPHLVGRLWARTRRQNEGATFRYADGWLANPNRFSLEPALTLGPGPFHTPIRQAPVRGHRLTQRRTAGDAPSCAVPSAAVRKRRTRRRARLLEIDYLLMVDDEARQGALRFAEQEGGPFLAPQGPTKIPPLVELPRLLSAAEHFAGDTDTDPDLRLLLAPGSSLGGARPKASVRDRRRASYNRQVPQPRATNSRRCCGRPSP